MENDSKFIYQEGELKFARIQCEFCSLYKKEENKCILFGNIPEKVKNNEVKCEELKSKTSNYPWQN